MEVLVGSVVIEDLYFYYFPCRLFYNRNRLVNSFFMRKNR